MCWLQLVSESLSWYRSPCANEAKRLRLGNNNIQTKRSNSWFLITLSWCQTHANLLLESRPRLWLGPLALPILQGEADIGD